MSRASASYDEVPGPADGSRAALVRVAERERIDTIFTVDRDDFEVYRLHGRRRLKIIP
jgi:hypothetical protein